MSTIWLWAVSHLESTKISNLSKNFSICCHGYSIVRGYRLGYRLIGSCFSQMIQILNFFSFLHQLIQFSSYFFLISFCSPPLRLHPYIFVFSLLLHSLSLSLSVSHGFCVSLSLDNRPGVIITGQIGPENNYISFHGQASETKTRPPAGYLRGLVPFFVFFQVWHLNPSGWRRTSLTGVWCSIVKLLWKIKVGWLTAVIMATLFPFGTSFHAFCLTCIFFCRLQHSGADPSWSHQHWYQTGQLLWKARRRQLPRWVCCMCRSETAWF